MRKKYYYILSLLMIFICSYSYGQGIITDALKKVKIFDFGDGRLVTTYEDVSNINIEARFDGCSIPVFNYSDLPSYAIKYTDRNNYLSSIVGGMIIPASPCDGATFIQDNFYLDFGYMGEGGWVSKVLGECGSEPNTDSENPGRSQKIWYCLKDDSYTMVREDYSPSSLTITADGVSCKVAQNLCPLGRDNCSHLLITPNVIKSLQAQVRDNNKGNIEKADSSSSFSGNSSGIYGQIVFKDRTPPWIETFEKDRFPTLGKNVDKICTGDFFSFKELTIKENGDTEVRVRMALGKIDKCPRENSQWTDSEEWVDDEQVYTIPVSGDKIKSNTLDEIISSPPNSCYGYMRYTVLAQDKGIFSKSKNRLVGNFNPGCASIVENDPNNCYGLPADNKYYEDLLTSPSSAKAWPYRENNLNIPAEEANKMTVDNFPAKDRVHEGYIKITDNDYPNILMKLTSSKLGEEKQIFFPPCMPAGQLTIVDSSNYIARYNSFSSADFPNQSDYNAFIGDSRNILRECNYEEVKKSDKRPFYTIIDLKETEFMSNKEAGMRMRFLGKGEPAFINKHFRLEDQSQSDTTTDGRHDERIEYNGESLFGKRNGTWKEVVALVENLDESEVQIQEDVEYQLGIWVDDSVKWANSYPNEDNIDPSQPVKAIPSGIINCKVTVDIPNQYPPYYNEYIFESNTSIKDDIKVVFREPTENIETEELKSESDLKAHNFPSIEVEATDYSGLKRKMKLYFRVKDENAKIKTLQRRHQQY